MANIVKDADSVSLVLNGRAITSFGVGDNIVLTPVNPHTSQINSSAVSYTHLTLPTKA